MNEGRAIKFEESEAILNFLDAALQRKSRDFSGRDKRQYPCTQKPPSNDGASYYLIELRMEHFKCARNYAELTLCSRCLCLHRFRDFPPHLLHDKSDRRPDDHRNNNPSQISPSSTNIKAHQPAQPDRRSHDQRQTKQVNDAVTNKLSVTETAFFVWFQSLSKDPIGMYGKKYCHANPENDNDG